MPSVPLISASPSLASSSTGDRPASLSATAAGRRTPWRSVTSPSPISASAQCDSGARSPEQPSEPYSCTTGVMPCVSMPASSLRGLQPDAGVAGGQGREPQQHQRPGHLALDLGAAAGGVRADQRASAAGRAARWGCAGWRGRRSRSRCRTPGWAPRPAPRRRRGPARAPRPRRRRARRRAPSRATATTSSKVDRSDADGRPRSWDVGWAHAPIPLPRRARARRAGSKLSRIRDTRYTWRAVSQVPAATRTLRVLRFLATQPEPVTAGAARRGLRAAPLDGLPPAATRWSTRASSSTWPTSTATGSGWPRSRWAAATPARSRSQRIARRPLATLVDARRPERPPRRPARPRRALRARGARPRPAAAGHRRRRAPAGPPDRQRPGDPGRPARRPRSARSTPTAAAFVDRHGLGPDLPLARCARCSSRPGSAATPPRRARSPPGFASVAAAVARPQRPPASPGSPSPSRPTDARPRRPLAPYAAPPRRQPAPRRRPAGPSVTGTQVVPHRVPSTRQRCMMPADVAGSLSRALLRTHSVAARWRCRDRRRPCSSLGVGRSRRPVPDADGPVVTAYVRATAWRSAA